MNASSPQIAKPFLFETDFRSPRPSAAAQRAAEAAARAEVEAHARGVQEGLIQAEAEIQGRLAGALSHLAQAAAALLARADAHDAEREAQAVEVAVLIARKVAGDALDAAPLASIGEAARTALQHLRGVPHLVVRVHDGLVEDAEALVKKLARERGYEGRLVVLGDPDMQAGDARIEWADGGIVRERARIEAAVADALGLPPTA
ncbi:flagellar assembly protein FliH [Methylobacterium sp. J-072]|uniref:FliH/SctL family protein n=1 Tax=Methylobacterium sp. J-072 TaxID=2836651 RepID=UPI001FBA4B9B|nr:FliH/SctL family protein [Methylobacterium sp. J-072]MCJ2092388.1 flagellar assembly protein FliH [Methylobacterium sp. J-072]